MCRASGACSITSASPCSPRVLMSFLQPTASISESPCQMDPEKPPPLDAVLPLEEREPRKNRRAQAQRLTELRDHLRSVDPIETVMLVAIPAIGMGPPRGTDPLPTPAVVQHLALSAVMCDGAAGSAGGDAAVLAADKALDLAFRASASEALFDYAVAGSRDDASVGLLSRTGRREWHPARLSLHALRSIAGRLGYVEQYPLPRPHPSQTAAAAAEASFGSQRPDADSFIMNELGFSALQAVCMADVVSRQNVAVFMRAGDLLRPKRTRERLFPARDSAAVTVEHLVSAVPPTLGVDLDVAERWLLAMTATPASALVGAQAEGAVLGNDLIAPHGPNDLWRHPLLNGSDGRWYAPSAGLLFLAVELLLADLLGTDGTRPPLSEQTNYRAARGRWAEDEVAAVLARSVGEAQHPPGMVLNVEWSVGPGPAAGEIDAVVSVDEVTLYVECKSGTWSETRGQDPANRRDLITKPIRQLARFGAALEEHGVGALSLTRANRQAFTIADETQVRAMLERAVRVPVYVSVDELGLFAADIARYRHARLLEEDERLPYVASHQDLLLVSELLSGAEAIAYLAQRARWNDEGSVLFLDEAELISMFLDARLGDEGGQVPGRRANEWRGWAEGQYFRARPGAPIETVEREPDTSVRLSAATRRLVADLEAQRPEGWTLAALAVLSCGPRSERQLADGLKLVTVGQNGLIMDSFTRRDPGQFLLLVHRGTGALAHLRSDRLFLERLLSDARVPLALSLSLRPGGAVEVVWTGDAQAAFVSKRPYVAGHDPDEPIVLTEEQREQRERAQLSSAERIALTALLNEVPARNAPCPCLGGRKWKHCHGA